MNSWTYAARLGIVRGLVETQQSLSSRGDQIWLLLTNGGFIAVLWFQRDATLPGTTIALGLATLPGLIGMNIALGGWMGTTMQLSVEREDGTLLRSKSVPNGMVGYLFARITLATVTTALGVVVFLVAGLFLLDGVADVPAAGWLMLLVVFLLGLLATLPWGAVVGSLVKNSGAGFGLSFLPASVLIGISGIFYPITALPEWVQWAAQVFPIYWLGLGMRHAILPDAAAAAEIGESWRTVEMFGVLGLWAVVGLALAPRVLRRMAERESGSAVEARREALNAQWGA